jgi:hypothetical protein
VTLRVPTLGPPSSLTCVRDTSCENGPHRIPDLRIRVRRGVPISRRCNPQAECMPTAQQRKHNFVHSVSRKLRKKENRLIKDYLIEAKRSDLDWRVRARFYKKIFVILEERCKRHK